MSDDDTGKKVGLVGAGLAGLLGMLAKMEHCVAAGGKAAAPAVHLAEDGARLGVRAAPLAGDVAKVGVHVVPKAATPRMGPALAQHAGTFAGLGSDAAGFAFEAAPLLVDDEGTAGNGLPYVMVPIVSGRSTLIALSPGAAEVALAGEPRKLLLRPAQIHGWTGLQNALPLLRHASPSVIVGRGPGDEIRVPEGAPIAATRVASACAAAGVVCTVVVCPDDAPEPCELHAAEAWKLAAHTLEPAAREALVVTEIEPFQRRLLPALAADEATRAAAIVFVHYDRTVRVVRATPVVSGNEPGAYRLTSPTWASCIASTRSSPPRSGRSRRGSCTQWAASAAPSPCSGS